ncbi:hydrogenase maturation nickel metallochaperone HypA [Fundidesulfovibrio butyratiphilus]
MHEMSIAQSILDIVNEEMEKNSLTRLIAVKVRYGRMTATVSEALEVCFLALVAGTALENARFETEAVPSRLACGRCGQEFEPELDRLFAPCPACGEEFGHTVLSGQELYIEYIEAQ